MLQLAEFHEAFPTVAKIRKLKHAPHNPGCAGGERSVRCASHVVGENFPTVLVGIRERPFMNPFWSIRRLIFVSTLALAFAAVAPAARAQESAPPPITNQDLLGGLKNPARWLTFSGDYNGQRHSPLKQLTPQNVAGLVPQWVFQTDLPGLAGRGLENTPLVVDGILYITGNYDEAWALDARTGRPIWSYRRRLPSNI